MSATCWLWFASCQWGIPISLSPPLPFIFLFTIHLTTYRGGRILVISCWIGNLTRSLTSNGDSDPRAFQLTASRGGWPPTCSFVGMILSRFQLTASRGGWRNPICTQHKDIYFNSQPHEETDDRGICTHWLFNHFNSQPHEEADCIMIQMKLKEYNFNSQPHEEADWCDCRKHHYRNISTHSLTRRLTTYDSNVIASMPISTHSLTRRLTKG